MNTKSTRIHGYQPAQLMLGFEPQQYHYNTDPAIVPDPQLAETPLPDHQYQLFAALRSENRMLANIIASYSQATKPAVKRKQWIPEPGLGPSEKPCQRWSEESQIRRQVARASTLGSMGQSQT